MSRPRRSFRKRLRLASLGGVLLGLVWLLPQGLMSRRAIYRWQDDRGRVHLVSSLERVPEAYRDRMRVFLARDPPDVAPDPAEAWHPIRHQRKPAHSRRTPGKANSSASPTAADWMNAPELGLMFSDDPGAVDPKDIIQSLHLGPFVVREVRPGNSH